MDAIAQKQAHASFYDSIRSFDVSQLWSCPWSDIENMRISPMSNVADDQWVIPLEWASSSGRSLGSRTIEFDRILPNNDNYRNECFKKRTKRLLLIDRFQTVRCNGRTLPAPTSSTWIKRSKQVLRAAAYSADNFELGAASSFCPDGLSLFAHLPPSQLAALKEAFPAWSIAMTARYNAFKRQDLFDDWPASDVSKYVSPPKPNSRASDPFSDTAYSEILRASLWLNSIQQDVLQAFLETKDIRETQNGNRKGEKVQAYRRKRVQEWQSSQLKIGDQFPFLLKLIGRHQETVCYHSWPLQTVLALKRMLMLCQTANAMIVLASTGMRIGELIAIERHAVFQNDGAWYLSGKQFKAISSPFGQERHWPLPSIAVQALQAQTRLAEIFAVGKMLWVMFSGKDSIESTPSLDHSIRNFGKCVGLADGRSLADLDGDLSPHRFRYTVARLVALTMTGGSQVLYDVLGHRDLDVTLGYALRDPALHEDIDKIRVEAKAAQSTELITHAESLGGAGGKMLRGIKADFLSRSGKASLDTDDLAQAATILGNVEIVRQGVLCTAQPLERGACSSQLGIRDHGACTPECSHRLETAAYVADRKRKVSFILAEIETADVLAKGFYRNQLFTNFIAAPELIDEFSADPRLFAAVRDMQKDELLRLPAAVQERIGALKEQSND